MDMHEEVAKKMSRRPLIYVDRDAVSLILVTLVVMVFIVLPIVLSARQDGRSDFCYVKANREGMPHYEVEAHRSWRMDFPITRTATLEEAIFAARAAGCQKLFTE